ncbi:baseplate J/gp47 family protein [Sneathiella sp.]|uniref:baseplate J/gp47 family protein n=1 Tax=Sneathiella sp. TaxID=1964365 RepID=UPI0039E4271E
MQRPPLKSQQNTVPQPLKETNTVSLISARATPDGARTWTVTLEIGGANIFSHEQPLPAQLTPDDFRLERLDGRPNTALTITDVKWVHPPTLVEISLFLDARAQELDNKELYQHVLRILRFPAHLLNKSQSAIPIFLLQSRQQKSTEFGVQENIPAPVIDYMAKDFEGFCQLIVTNLEKCIPDWHEVAAADSGAMLIEILAYVADYLSYRQDFVANEAYLKTALLRTSLARHARLLGYHPQEGCAARIILTCEVSAPLEIPANTAVLSNSNSTQRKLVSLNSDLFQRILSGGATCFETTRSLKATPLLNQLRIHDFGLQEFTLYAGSTSVVVEMQETDSQTGIPLTGGDIVVLQRIALSERTRSNQDSGYIRAHAVRLTHVEKLRSLHGNAAGRILVGLHWDRSDALPVDLPVVLKDEGIKLGPKTVSAVFANAIEAEFGLTRSYPVSSSEKIEPCDWQPTLPAKPLQRLASTDDDVRLSIDRFLSPRDDVLTHPAIRLLETPLNTNDLSSDSYIWHPTRDLLRHGNSDRVFKVDTNEDNTITLRFGQNGMGRTPSFCRHYTAEIREATGKTSNVGANVMTIACPPSHKFEEFADRLVRINNPLPASTTIFEESKDSIRLNSADILKDDKICGTLEDYANLAKALPDVKAATAWNIGDEPWPFIYVAILAEYSNVVDETLAHSVKKYLDLHRPVGRRLIVTGPKPVPLEIALEVIPKRGFAQTDIERDLVHLVGNTNELENHAVFSMQKITFNQILYASQIIAATAVIAGIDMVRLLAFRRTDKPGPTISDQITFARDEIPMLANKPNQPAGGQLTVQFNERVSS